MIHHEAGLAAFLEGDVGDDEAAAWDAHLLSCTECWNALDEAWRGRILAGSLRHAAPAALHERVVAALGAQTQSRRAPRSRHLLVSVGVAAVVVAVAAALLLPRHTDGGHDARPIAVVLHMAAKQTEQPPVLGRSIHITRLNVSGHDVVLARAEDPFPMPMGAIALTDDPQSPWLARRGDVNLLCFSQPAPILLAGRASPETLTQVAAALGISHPLQSNRGLGRLPG